MTTNERLYEAALDAIKALFGDTTVSKEEAKTNLESLKDEMDILISTLEDD